LKHVLETLNFSDFVKEQNISECTLFSFSVKCIKIILFGLFRAGNLCIRTKQETTEQVKNLFSAGH